MSEKDVATEEDMSRLRSEFLNALNERLIDSLATETVDEFVVIDFTSVASNFPWSDHLLLFAGFVVSFS